MKFFRDNGLTLVLMLAFAGALLGMLLAGRAAFNETLAEHAQPAVTLSGYMVSGDFLSALFENWESEFLQMAAYVILTAMLFQRGSAESRDPDDPERENDALPRHLRGKGALVRWLYLHGLGVALVLLFVLSFIFHWLYSVRAHNLETSLHGSAPEGAFEYLASADFWFESFQNWQSEFLSTAVLVVLSIVLRYRGSPESKPAGAANAETGA
jgi:hypothetical protein